jgi:predicted dienelactone hydrolase
MKWIRRGVAALAALLAVVLVYSVLTAVDSTRPVGFQTMQARAANGQAFGIAVWYPSDSAARPTTLLGTRLMKVAADGEVSGQNLPLIVFSHGNGGGPGSHADLAMALAAAGYVVAAPMHTGDNYAGQSLAASATLFAGRVQELRATVDHLLSAWPGHTHINSSQVGAFGFSDAPTLAAWRHIVPSRRSSSVTCCASSAPAC